MHSLTSVIENTRPQPGELAIFWLAQAGFAFKTASGVVVCIDPYLSDVVEKAFGFKRMMACPIAAEDVPADLVICTHEHLDHMDSEALPILAKCPRTRFAGPAECVKGFEKAGISPERRVLLTPDSEINLTGVRIFSVYADHGDLAPDAIGVVLDFDGIRVYHTGDTAYRPERLRKAIELSPDVLLPCINGRYGNMDAEEAALLTRDVSPQLAIPAHFWMFVEHGGDPAAFIEHSARHAPKVKAVVMKPGEMLLFRKPNHGLRCCSG
ncbi:MAG: MBL fold metallo-hydrolase [Bryobacteraceae bacterium]